MWKFIGTNISFNGNWVKCNPNKIWLLATFFLIFSNDMAWVFHTGLEIRLTWNAKKSVGYFENPVLKICRFSKYFFKNRRPFEIVSSKYPTDFHASHVRRVSKSVWNIHASRSKDKKVLLSTNWWHIFGLELPQFLLNNTGVPIHLYTTVTSKTPYNEYKKSIPLRPYFGSPI